jgi:hypothetical protein
VGNITVRERVRRASRFIDEHYGRGWHRRVSIRRLDMSDGCECILGQLEGDYGDYYDAVDRLDLSFDDATRLGLHRDWRGPRWETLDEAWRDEIRERRKARR